MNTPPHPADFLNEVLMPATGRSDGEVARLLGISVPVFYTILTREKPISPATAAMLGRLFNTGEEFWLKMQAEYDRFVAPQHVVDSGVVPAEPSARPALGQAMAIRNLPKPPVAGGFQNPPDHSAMSEFHPPDVASWSRLEQGDGRSSIG
jgi:addiction module HigA family antidote